MPDQDDGREMEQKVNTITVTMERLNGRIDRSEEIQASLISRLERFDNLLRSSDSERPGIATRVDRIEQTMLRNQRMMNYLLGGGVLSTLSTLVVLVKVLAISKAW